MSASFEVSNYSIVSSFNETSIYVKAMDKVTFNCYENTIDSSELFISIELEDAYKMMIKCFQGEDNHKVSIHIISDVMKLEFHAVLGGYLKMNFEILLREKIMSNDAQLTINFQRIEQTYLNAIEKLTEKIDKLELLVNAVSYAEICIIKPGNTITNNFVFPINTRDILLYEGNQYIDYSKINMFYQLEKLTLFSCFCITDNQPETLTNFNINNNYVKEIVLSEMSSNFIGLDGLDRMPNVEKLTIILCSGLTNIVSTLESYSHKIKFIKIVSCNNINDSRLTNYCQKNNIVYENSNDANVYIGSSKVGYYNPELYCNLSVKQITSNDSHRLSKNINLFHQLERIELCNCKNILHYSTTGNNVVKELIIHNYQNNFDNDSLTGFPKLERLKIVSYSFGTSVVVQALAGYHSKYGCYIKNVVLENCHQNNSSLNTYCQSNGITLIGGGVK